MDVAATPEEIAMDKVRLSLGTWSVIIAIIVSLGGISAALMSRIFASKDEVHTIQISQVRDKGVAKLQEWRIRTVETKVDNMQAQQTRIDRNVDKLLDRFRVLAEPQPAYKSLPPPPTFLDTPPGE